jgi:hypothetical protein
MGSKKKSPRSARVTAIGVLGLVLAGLGAAIMMASHESSSQIARLPTVDAAPSRIAAEPFADAAPSRIAAEPIADAAPAQIAAKPTAKKLPAARPQPKARATVTASAVSAMPVTRPAEAAAAPKASSVESASRHDSPEATPVTITGCLERSDTTFRLTETTGTEAPKSRSWKRGFLKKGMAPVGVVDAGNRLNLSSHVGQRVSVTGLLVDREMTLRSLQRVAAFCD